MKKRNSLLVIMVPVLLAIAYFAGKSQMPLEKEHFRMGTVINQLAYGRHAKKAMNEVAKRIYEIESLMTINAPGGEINILNDAAGKEAVRLSPETFKLLEKSINFSELSRGAFDVTIGPLVREWGIHTENPRILEENSISKLLPLVNYRDIHLFKEQLSAKLEKSGQVVDLGGIAKGYAGDEAIRIYKSHGISSAYINIGGNVVVLGNKPNGEPWRIAITNPRMMGQERYIGAVDVKDNAVVTSGDYERYFEKDGIRYHHIIDPKTGEPADSGLISVTIIAKSSTDADALSTAAFVLGLDKGKQLIEIMANVEAIFVTKDKEIYTTDGLKNNFIFNTDAEGFKYIN